MRTLFQPKLRKSTASSGEERSESRNEGSGHAGTELQQTVSALALAVVARSAAVRQGRPAPSTQPAWLASSRTYG
jgi:hypothetical protein